MKESISVNLKEMIIKEEIIYIATYGNISKYKTNNNDYFYLVKKEDNSYDYFEYNDSFEIVSGFHDNRCLIKKNGKYGYIDENFNIIIEPKFIEAKDFKEGYAVFKENDKYGAIDINGNIIINPVYETFDSFSEGYAVVSNKGLYGHINTNGEILNEVLSYSSCTPFKCGYSKILSNGNTSYINKNGEQLDYEINNLFDSNNKKLYSNEYFEIFFISSGFGYSTLNTNGEILEYIYSFAKPCNNKFFAKMFDDKEYYKLYDENFNCKETIYNFIKHVNNSFYIASDNSGKYGVIDIDLNVIVPLTYTENEIYELFKSDKTFTSNNKTYILSQGIVEEYTNDKITINTDKSKVKDCLLLDTKKEVNGKSLLEEEILTYLSKYNSNKLNEEFELLNNEYKSKLDNLIIKENNKRKNKTITLTLDKEDNIKDVYDKYIHELKGFLELLKEKQNLIDVMNEIEKCISFVELGETNIDEVFYKDINTLLSLYKVLDEELLIKNKNRFIKRLKKDLKDIKHYINDNNKKDLSYNDIPSWKLHFRNELQVIINEFKNDYDMQGLKHAIESKEEMIENLHANKYNHLLHEYNYIKRTYNSIQETINLYELKYNLDFSKIKQELEIFKDIIIDYYDKEENTSKKIIDLLKKILQIESEVLYLIEPYKYEIDNVSLQR